MQAVISRFERGMSQNLVQCDVRFATVLFFVQSMKINRVTNVANEAGWRECDARISQVRQIACPSCDEIAIDLTIAVR